MRVGKETRTLDEVAGGILIAEQDELETRGTLPADAQRVHVCHVQVDREKVALIPSREYEQPPAQVDDASAETAYSLRPGLLCAPFVSSAAERFTVPLLFSDLREVADDDGEGPGLPVPIRRALRERGVDGLP